MQVASTIIVVEMDIEETVACLPDDSRGILTADLDMAYVKQKSKVRMIDRLYEVERICSGW